MIRLLSWSMVMMLMVSLPMVLSADDTAKLVDTAKSDAAKSDLATQVERLVKRGLSRAGRGDNDGALADFNQVLKLDPKNVAAQLGLGKLNSSLRYYAEAVKNFDKYVAAKPDDKDGWSGRGDVNRMTGDLNAAIKDYSKALELDLNDDLIYNCRGVCYLSLGLGQKALADYSKAIELNPNSSTYWLNRAQARQYLDDCEGSVADYTQAIKLDPTSANPHEFRGVCYARLGQQAAAQQDWDESIKLAPQEKRLVEDLQQKMLPIYKKISHPKTAQEFYTRGKALYDANYKLAAVLDLQLSIGLDDFNPDSVYWLAKALDDSSLEYASIEAFKKCIEIDDRYATAYTGLGDILGIYLYREADALPYYKKAMELKGDFAGNFAGAGYCQTETGDLQGALQNFNKAIDLSPDYTFAIAGRSLVYLRQGNFDKAQADAEKALSLAPNDFTCLRSRAQIKAAKGDYPGAIADFDSSIKSSDTPRARMYRGLTYLRMGKPTEAQADFDAAVKLQFFIKPRLDAEVAKLKAQKPAK